MGTLTPYDKSDDCSQYASRKQGDWALSSLSRAYKKSGTPIINKCKELGILVSNFIPTK